MDMGRTIGMGVEQCFLCISILLLATLQGVLSSTHSSRATIPFSTKYPELVIPSERVCLPRIRCDSKLTRDYAATRGALPPFTDYLSELGKEGFSFGDVELPEGANLGVGIQDDDLDGPQAVVAETDNYLIDQSEASCEQDRRDYCDREQREDWLGGEHTMCKFCGLGDKCPYFIDPANNDLTGRVIEDNQVKELIVQLHNEVRSKIARGACDQPKAGCMGPVVWDDELARVAQKWADQCADVDYLDDEKRKDPHLFHDPHPQRKVAMFSDWQGVGQNVARDIAPGRRGLFNATKLVGHWFRQIRFFDPAGVEEFGSGNQCSRGVGYYTQLVWQNTTHVGCGWSQFQYRGFAGYFENFLVCNYGPSANIWKDPVYDIAETTCDCPCVDCDHKEGMCPSDPRFGSWGGWSRWGECSKTCAGGIRERTRECTAPKAGGDDREPCGLCKGENNQHESCNDHFCPFWSEWEPWTSCSSSCGSGERKRQRSCNSPNFKQTFDRMLSGDLPCPGPAEEVELCEAGPCPAWTPWTEWSSCSQSCGGGSQHRVRECAIGRSYDDCEGDAREERACKEDQCPSWSPWTPWSECSVSCGGGRRGKVRQCVLPVERGGVEGCKGEAEAEEDCNSDECPEWNPWSEWTQCSKTCGGGERSRGRDCVLPSYQRGSNDLGCLGDSDEREACNEESCPVWTEWSDWTECPVTCGGGVQVRARECVESKERVNGCQGEKEETKECGTKVCPIWTEWTEWTECSATCGGGSRSKVRECTLPKERIVGCVGEDKATETCASSDCPTLTPWSEWTSCTTTCGGGTRKKTRECVYGRDAINNDCLEPLEKSEPCGEEVCPVYTEWTEWTECTRTCGGGTKRRVRECIQGSAEACERLGPAEEVEDCNTGKCPAWTDWTEWTPCTKTCGGGSQRRERACVAARAVGRLFCPGPGDEQQECGTEPCPIWTEWTEWAPCTRSCGGGQTTQRRECVLPRSGGELGCEGEPIREGECNTQTCPSWGPWTEWTECSATCGGGSWTKTRQCLFPEGSEAAGQCVGDEETTEACNTQTCPSWTPWGDWTSCSKSCGGGRRTRGRQCLKLTRDGGYDCDGEAEESEECKTNGCPDFSQWTEWSECSVSCGGGVRNRERHCEADGEAVCACQCFGPIEEFETCGTNICAEWSEWGEWGECSKTCGDGIERRERRCNIEGACDGDATEERACKKGTCPEWTPWSPWSQCSSSCGPGSKERSRRCAVPGVARYSIEGCVGDSEEREGCTEGACRGWGQWQEWTPCTKTCGGGTRMRERLCGLLSRDAGECLGEGKQEEKCKDQVCPSWASWGDWGGCSATCGRGNRERRRECQPSGDANECVGQPAEQGVCEDQPCQQSEWGGWGEWGSCSRSCGEGRETRRRQCVTAGVARLGLLTSPCPGAGEEERLCQREDCPRTGCEDLNAPSEFFGFGGRRPARNIADCSWDFFSCTNNYGTWPENKLCCDMRFKRCCMVVMGPQTTTHRPIGGYGPPEDEKPEVPDIFLEEDLNIPNLENPIEDVDLGDGTMVFRPETSAVVAEIDSDSVCGTATSSSYLVANPEHCSTYFSCQSSGPGKWIANRKTCSSGTVFNPAVSACDYPQNVAGRCGKRGRGRKARVIDGFNSSDEEKLADGVDLEEREFLRVFEEVNNALYSKQTQSELNVDAAPQFFAFTSAASLLIPTLFRMIVIAGMAIAIF